MYSFNNTSVSEIRKRIKTEIPPELVGVVYLRNGPNPYLMEENLHLFDGDGMIHVCEFEKDSLLYYNKWIETGKLITERYYKMPIYNRLNKLNGVDIFKNLVNKYIYNTLDIFNSNKNSKKKFQGEGNANTSIIQHAGKLLALNEMDYPYQLALQNSRIRTVDRYDFNGKLKHNVNAHPKIDDKTGDMIILGYSLFKSPYCQVSYVNKRGELYKTINIDIPYPILIHDFGLTDNYVIVLDLPLQFNIWKILTSEFPIKYNSEMKSRMGLLDRRSNNIKWLEFKEPQMIFHIANTWEQNGVIVMYAFCYDTETFDINKMDKQRPILYKFTIKDDVINSHKVGTCYGEFPEVVNFGKQEKYIYYCKISELGFTGIIKHDTETDESISIELPENKYCGEVNIHKNKLLTYVYDVKKDKSELWIINTDSLQLEKQIKLNCRVPFGFHGLVLEK
jgi:carotenoid cleavage dioxygenase-like enzyme